MDAKQSLRWNARLESESIGRVWIEALPGSGVESLSGKLRGPFCEYGRTLPADFALKHTPLGSETVAAEAGVHDLCCWSPAMPFRYQLEAEAVLSDGSKRSLDTHVCIRRWHVDQASFRLQLKRFVLRGGTAAPTLETIEPAHEAEASLLVATPDEAFCSESDRAGVAVIADLRAAGDAWPGQSGALDWHDSVLLTLLSPQQLGSDCRPQRSFVAVAAAAGSEEAEVLVGAPDAVVVELGAGEVPPAWMSACGLPVIVVRRGGDVSGFTEVRQHCDRLQAELAPEFDLAGYFVA